MDAFKKQVGGNHYKDMAIGPVEYCHKNKLGPCEFAVVKYVSRHKSKGGRKDIEKAIHFLEMLLEMDYPKNEVDASQYLRRHDDISPENKPVKEIPAELSTLVMLLREQQS